MTQISQGNITNWAGNLTYSAGNLHIPGTVTEMQAIVKKCTKVRALGSRHSFNEIADGTKNQVSTEKLNKIISLDKEKNTVTIEAGVRYGELCCYLHEQDYALHNLASLPHISVAGACATATHGSGIKNESLASAVTAIEFINPDGELVFLSKEKDKAEFSGAVVSLGALGIVTKLTLALQPAFTMKQWVYQDMPMSQLETNFVMVLSAGYSVSLFTNWKNATINQVWVKEKISWSTPLEMPATLYGGKPATRHLHPLADLSAEHCTDQLGIEAAWYERMPHFKMGFTPSSGKELQSEYFIAIEQAYEGLMAVEKLAGKISPHLLVSEIRAIAADDQWMSPFYKKTCVAFHFTWKQDDEVQKLLPLIEEVLAPFDPRPHWGKLFTMSPHVLQQRIENLDDFKKLLAKYDPAGKFRNEFIEKNLYGV